MNLSMISITLPMKRKKHHGISRLFVCQSLVFAFLQNYGMMLRYAAAIILESGKAFFNSIEIKAAGLYFSADVVFFFGMLARPFSTL